MTADRRAELRANLADVRIRIARACASAARQPAEVGLLAVSKNFPASDVAELAALGQLDMGESRHQEVVAKLAALAELRSAVRADRGGGVNPHGVRWHFLGRLQRNKATAVAGYATCVESVDRVELLPGLRRGAESRGRSLDVLIQVDLDSPLRPARGGIEPAGAARLADVVAGCDELVLRGVMAVAPREGDPRRAFARLREVAEQIRADHPGAQVLSAGMSGDLEAAVVEGSTLVRIGTALFGRRTPALG